MTGYLAALLKLIAIAVAIGGGITYLIVRSERRARSARMQADSDQWKRSVYNPREFRRNRDNTR
ncbi:hypothetical protein [Burkholderia territorii]|uniref:hypothetical protein n=1 Tax=Burkholderia territorii TaxID=1503055 RepID=UPI000ADF8ED6|nr:hypothetical protein [Burkholderia territorii]